MRPAAACVAVAVLATSPAAAAGGVVREVAAGVLLHDSSYFSDYNEDGVDLAVEAVFRRPNWRAWRWLLSPYPMIGADINLVGDTSFAYAGLRWEVEPSDRLLVAGALGLAAHTGRLERSEEACRVDNCGFGSRATIYIAAEIGWRLDERNAVALVVDHISHAGWFAEQNEGVDNIGVRWRYRLGAGAPSPG
ncbi:MAG: acyloxyacyl hydrolase [Pseudomonadota bacterium]